MSQKPDRLLLRIVYPDGMAYMMPAGGPLEMDLENELAEGLIAAGVGFFKTSAQVEAAFRQIFKERMFKFKDRVANP